MSIHDDDLYDAHDALDRMRRAAEMGTGCHLTSSMIKALSVSSIGQFWSDEDPRSTKKRKKCGDA